jgi:hypothetical protein
MRRVAGALGSASAVNSPLLIRRLPAIELRRYARVPWLAHLLRTELLPAEAASVSSFLTVLSVSAPVASVADSSVEAVSEFRSGYGFTAIETGEIIIDRNTDFFHRFRANAFNRFQLLGRHIG